MKIDEMEAEIRDADRRLAALKANLADVQTGRKRFFSWTEFMLGLSVVCALAGSFYVGLSGGATMIVVAIVALAIAGVLVLRIKRKVKDLDGSA